MAVQIGYEAWLIGRNMDASKKILVATRILVCDFELFIGALVKRRRADKHIGFLPEAACTGNGPYSVYLP